jgi:hypothetical protein
MQQRAGRIFTGCGQPPLARAGPPSCARRTQEWGDCEVYKTLQCGSDSPDPHFFAWMGYPNHARQAELPPECGKIFRDQLR